MGWQSGQCYSLDLRDRVPSVVDGSMPVQPPMPGVSIAYIYRALLRHRATGDRGINPNGGTRRASRRAGRS